MCDVQRQLMPGEIRTIIDGFISGRWAACRLAAWVWDERRITKSDAIAAHALGHVMPF